MGETEDNQKIRTRRQANGTRTPAQRAAYRASQIKRIESDPSAVTLEHVRAKPKRLGRPSSYKHEYAEVVIANGIKGHTLTGIAHIIGVSPTQLSRWEELHPEFREAVARAKAARLYGCELDLIDIRKNGGDSSRLGAVKFAMTNYAPEEYKERFESTSNVNVSLSSLITDAMKTIEHEATSPKRLPKPDEDE